MTETTSLRERRLAQARASLAASRETRERYIAMITRYTETIKRLERKIARLEKPPRPQPAPIPQPPAVETVKPPAIPLATMDDDMPDFLRRKKEGEAKDAAARAEILADQAERKRMKDAARIGNMKAKQRGDTKRMPLTGKAALDAIRG